jgi:hypothetical protein
MFVEIHPDGDSRAMIKISIFYKCFVFGTRGDDDARWFFISTGDDFRLTYFDLPSKISFTPDESFTRSIL